ncbi:DUF1543 domain-containing protein [Acidocella sp.]|uniref:DUF1543 domain-containing protein n=1 Tax=Acidocella sp. TaxID=50710 RepID=UPI002619E337|nr:DUF1543 domain-containing protein [Acidocella sp.]
MKLFMVVVGGDCQTSNVELHDVRFCVGARIEDCHGELHRQWWGDPASLHLDGYSEVTQADGFDISLEPGDPAPSDPRLYFVNLGGYVPGLFGEAHENVLIVADSPAAAKAKALARAPDWREPHKDQLFELDKALDVSAQLGRLGLRLVLRAAKTIRAPEIVLGYVPIGHLAGQG